jgi:hypothetical protein
MLLSLVKVELLHLRVAIIKDSVVSTTVNPTQMENHSRMTVILAIAITALSLAQKWLVQDVKLYNVRKAIPAPLRMVLQPVNLIILVHLWIAVI